MSGERWLDWAILAVSLFNTMLVLWLGLTVLLNADRRHRGVWLMGAGLFFGAAFLLSHSAIVGQPSGMNTMVLNLWWRAGWVAVILAPFAWYLAVLWYGGFWGGPVNTLTQRHRGWLWLMTLGLMGLMGYAAIAAWSMVATLRPIDSLLLAIVPVALFHALYSWRSLREHEHFVARLRPFLYTQAIPSNPSHASSSAGDLLAALCRHVLDTQQAQLIPLGSVASLAGPPLCYPATSTAPPLRPPPDLAQGMTLLDPMQFAPYGWAIPVWSERGLIGVLLIGKKEDGGLYTQEEMEIAQTTAERILQLLASEQMVRHLMELQRRRTTEQRVMDLRTRRTLHDEILPALHLAVLQLSGADRQQPTIQNTLATLADAHRRIAVLLTDAQPAPARDPDPCELVGGLQTLLNTEFAHQFEEIHWHSNAESEESEDSAVYVDAVTGEIVLGAAREVIRNAALHGRGDRPTMPLRLEISLCVQTTELLLSIRDNGVGIGAAATHPSGSGNGLALHSTLLAMVGGYLAVDSLTKEGTLVRIVVTPMNREA